MAVSPTTNEVIEDPVHFTGEQTVSIMTYYGGFVAYLPEITSGLCGKDLRGLAISLTVVANRVDELNRKYEAGLIDAWNFPTEEIPVRAL